MHAWEASCPRELAEERDEDIARRRRHGGLRRRAWRRRLVKRVRPKPAVDRIQGIVDGNMHHGIEPRFVEGVVERRDAGLRGGHARVGVPDGDGVAAGRGREGGSRLGLPRTGEWGTYGGHKGQNEAEPCLEAHHTPFFLLSRLHADRLGSGTGAARRAVLRVIIA